MDTFLLELNNISISFGDTALLKNFSLRVKKGEKIHLNAPSGSGKSTLLKMILGFSPLQEGQILLNGIPLSPSSINDFREHMGYLSQKMNFRHIVVRNLITEILNYKSNNSSKLKLDKDNNFIINFLSFLELSPDILDKNIETLSGGEKQRIGFLILNILNKDIWILDEITSSLDIGLKEKILEYILKSHKTVILVSHDKSDILNSFRKVNI